MNTMLEVYEQDNGLQVTVQSFITLTKKTGLKCLPSRNIYSSKDLFKLLQKEGPLWCAGNWYGSGHVIVLTGIDSGQVFLNDPDGGQRKSGTLAWFNSSLYNGLDGCVMAKDPARY